MHLSQTERDAKLNILRDAEGRDTLEAMLEAATLDSVSPAICVNCDHTTEMEPDQDRGWCERCGLRFPIKDGFPVLVVEEAELPAGCESIGQLPCQREAKT